MCNSKPPPESEQLIATGDNTQLDQPTLKLTLDDILKGGSQLDGRVISVSGLMKFIFENCKNAENNNLTSQPLPSAQQEYDSDSQKLVDSIDNSKSTLNEASGLLQKCAENLEEMKALLRSLSESSKKIEEFEQEVEREIKSTTEAVMGLLKDLAGDTATVTTDDDDDDHSPDDDKDSDGSNKPDEDPKEDDTSEGPPNSPNDPSVKNEDSKEDLPTDSGKDQSADESTESYLVETTTTEIDKAEDRSDSSNEDPKGGDTSGEHTDQSNDPSTKNEDSKESHPTYLIEEESKHGSTESAAETDVAEDSYLVLPRSTTPQTPNEPMDSVSEGILPTETSSTLPLGSEGENLSASKLDDKETVEDKLSEGDESKQQVLETELGGRSEEAPVKEASPQQEAELPQEPSALEDLPLSAATEEPEEQEEMKGAGPKKVTDVDSKDMKHESKDSEPSLPAPGLNKKEGNFDETPDAGIASQQTTEPSQEPSSPTESAIEKTPIEGKADKSGDAKVPELGEVQEHDSEPAARTLSKSQEKKLKKKEKKENKNTEEEDAQLFFMDVMLSLFIGAMIDIRAKKLEPRQAQLPSLLEEISLFHRQGHYETYARISAENLFRILYGVAWKKKNDLASKICQQIAHFCAQPAAKTCAQDIVAYLHFHADLVTSRQMSRNRQKGKQGLPIPQLFAKFNRQLVSWTTTKWSQSLKRYGTHRRLETEDKSNSCAWRDKPAEYSSNPRVVQRILYYRSLLETFENRLISDCYEYLVFHEENLNKYHDVLDFDLDSVCEWPSESVELRFFSTIFGFDGKLLKNLYGEQAIDDNLQDPEPESEPDYTEDEASDEEDDEPVAELEMVTIVSLTILLSTMKSIHDGKVTSEKVNFPDFLKEICLFHETEEYENNYKDAEFFSDTLIEKLFGSREELENRVANEQEFFSILENYCHDPEFGDFASQILKFIDHSYNNAPETSEDDATTTKANFVSTVVIKVLDTTRAWIFAQFESNVNDYNNYHLKRKENIRKSSNDAEKYNWKAASDCFLDSIGFRTRTKYYMNRSEQFFDGHVQLSIYKFLMNIVESNEFINDDIHFIMTRPGDSMNVAEAKFFNSLFGFNKWSHWFSNYLLTN